MPFWCSVSPPGILMAAASELRRSYQLAGVGGVENHYRNGLMTTDTKPFQNYRRRHDQTSSRSAFAPTWGLAVAWLSGCAQIIRGLGAAKCAAMPPTAIVSSRARIAA